MQLRKKTYANACLAMMLIAAMPGLVLADQLDELQSRQEKVQAVVKNVLPATVCVTGGVGMGSGVVVSKDGLVLTAGHVSGKPDREVTLIFPDGKMVKGKTLGANRSFDAGMIQITEDGEWPYVEIGKSKDVEQGQWVVCAGHPGGWRVGRTPPIRLGRVVMLSKNSIITDCSLIGGDSGGPLFDLDGRLIGIHSSIGASLAENRHVPIDRFHESWDRMAKGEAWGNLADMARFQLPEGLVKGGFLGVRLQETEDGNVSVVDVVPGSAADKAGMKSGDIILRVGSEDVESVRDMVLKVARRKPGAEVKVAIQRGDEKLDLVAKLGKRE